MGTGGGPERIPCSAVVDAPDLPGAPLPLLGGFNGALLPLASLFLPAAGTALVDGALLPLASLPLACRLKPDSGIRGVTPASVSLDAVGLVTTDSLIGI